MPNEIVLPEPKPRDTCELKKLAEALYPLVNGYFRAILDDDTAKAWKYSQMLRKLQEKHTD